MENKDIYEICHQVQQNSGCHVKYIQKLIRFYKKTDFEEFVTLFMQCLEICFEMKFLPKNVFVDRFFMFCANFTAKLSEDTTQSEDENTQNDETQTHPFLKRIINEVLQYHNLDDFRARYHSCEFIKLLLKSLHDDTYVDNDTCNNIQEAMLERIKDSNAKIRLQACTALARLQEPSNRVCPVIASYIQALSDPSASVRKFVVENIAPTAVTIAKIVEHTRDVDFSVRYGAFKKCAAVPPNLFKIADRQAILNQGFIEQDKTCKKSFMEVLLPKWLTAFDGQFLTLLKAIKLDAFEDDIKNTEFLSKNVLEVYFGLNTIADILEQLPINEEKVIPNDKLCSESVLYWFNLHKFLRGNAPYEDYIDTIVPELTPFCQYIERIIKEKCVDKVEEWQYLETQYILHQLFEMIGNFDYSDEVGRKNLHDLILKLLKDYKFEVRNITQMVKILYKLNTGINLLVNELYELITEIRERYVEAEPKAADIGHRNFKLAGLKVKLNLLAEDMEDAIQEKDFKMAELKRNEHKLIEEKIEEIIKEPFEVEKVKVLQQDEETIYKCLDIIICLLKLPALITLPMSLKDLVEDMISTQINTDNVKIYWKLFNAISLCALLDENTAKDNLKLLCTPALAYRVLPDYDRTTLITSIGVVSDLLRVYGTELFCTDKIKQKKLYRQDFDTAESVDFESISCENIIEVIVDMMDDDDDEVREMAGNSLSKLVSNGVMTSPSLISRIILKWFNPLTEQNDPKLHHVFGQCVLNYRNEVKDSTDVLETAIIPTLNAIGNAPRTSPLADINIDNALKVLAYLTTEKTPTDIFNSHQNLSCLLVNQIMNKPLDKCVVLWTKFLCYLEPATDATVLKEIKATANSALTDLVDKTARRHLEKYILLLNQDPNETNATVDTNATQDNTNVGTTLPSINEEEIIEDPDSPNEDNGGEDVTSATKQKPVDSSGDARNLQIETPNTKNKKNVDSSGDATNLEIAETPKGKNQKIASPITEMQSRTRKKQKPGDISEDTRSPKAKKPKIADDLVESGNKNSRSQNSDSEQGKTNPKKKLKTDKQKEAQNTLEVDSQNNSSGSGKKHQISDSDCSSPDDLNVGNPNKGNKRAKRRKLQKANELNQRSSKSISSERNGSQGKLVIEEKSNDESQKSDDSSRKSLRISLTKIKNIGTSVDKNRKSLLEKFEDNRKNSASKEFGGKKNAGRPKKQISLSIRNQESSTDDKDDISPKRGRPKLSNKSASNDSNDDEMNSTNVSSNLSGQNRKRGRPKLSSVSPDKKIIGGTDDQANSAHKTRKSTKVDENKVTLSGTSSEVIEINSGSNSSKMGNSKKVDLDNAVIELSSGSSTKSGKAKIVARQNRASLRNTSAEESSPPKTGKSKIQQKAAAEKQKNIPNRTSLDKQKEGSNRISLRNKSATAESGSESEDDSNLPTKSGKTGKSKIQEKPIKVVLGKQKEASNRISLRNKSATAESGSGSEDDSNLPTKSGKTGKSKIQEKPIKVVLGKQKEASNRISLRNKSATTESGSESEDDSNLPTRPVKTGKSKIQEKSKVVLLGKQKEASNRISSRNKSATAESSSESDDGSNLPTKSGKTKKLKIQEKDVSKQIGLENRKVLRNKSAIGDTNEESEDNSNLQARKSNALQKSPKHQTDSIIISSDNENNLPTSTTKIRKPSKSGTTGRNSPAKTVKSKMLQSSSPKIVKNKGGNLSISAKSTKSKLSQNSPKITPNRTNSRNRSATYDSSSESEKESNLPTPANTRKPKMLQNRAKQGPNRPSLKNQTTSGDSSNEESYSPRSVKTVQKPSKVATKSNSPKTSSKFGKPVTPNRSPRTVGVDKRKVAPNRSSLRSKSIDDETNDSDNEDEEESEYNDESEDDSEDESEDKSDSSIDNLKNPVPTKVEKQKDAPNTKTKVSQKTTKMVNNIRNVSPNKNRTKPVPKKNSEIEESDSSAVNLRKTGAKPKNMSAPTESNSESNDSEIRTTKKTQSPKKITKNSASKETTKFEEMIDALQTNIAHFKSDKDNTTRRSFRTKLKKTTKSNSGKGASGGTPKSRKASRTSENHSSTSPDKSVVLNSTPDTLNLTTTSKDSDLQHSPQRKSVRKTRETWKKREAAKEQTTRRKSASSRTPDVPQVAAPVKRIKAMQNAIDNFVRSNSSNSSSQMPARNGLIGSPASSVKRKKVRGENSSMASSLDETLLHTIIHDDEMEMGVISLLDDSFESHKSTPKKLIRTNKVISILTSSESDSPKRRKKKHK